MHVHRALAQTLAATAALGTATALDATWELDAEWPSGLPADANYFSAIAVDASGVVHVSVRSGLDSPIIMLDDDAGELLGEWGADSVFFDNSTGSWGAHGLAAQANSDGTNQIWIADILEHTAKVTSVSNKLTQH